VKILVEFVRMVYGDSIDSWKLMVITSAIEGVSLIDGQTDGSEQKL
jgi:hypothetical protein